MASAKWILVVGDDDMLIPDGLSSLLKILPTLDEVDYILLNTKLDANNNLLKLNAGFQDLDSIKNSLLNSINEYGFCGSHLMSQAVAQKMRGRTYEHLRTWPSFGTFINNAFPLNKKFYFFETPVVWQDANGQAMTWQPTDWLKLLVRMQNVFLINLDAYSDKQFCKHVVSKQCIVYFIF